MIAFNLTSFYLIVCYAHMKIFLLYMGNISFTFIIIVISISIIIVIIIKYFSQRGNGRTTA